MTTEPEQAPWADPPPVHEHDVSCSFGNPTCPVFGEPEPPRIRRRCAKRGHKWRQKVWGHVGDDVCARWGCTAERANPRSLPPADWGPQ